MPSLAAFLFLYLYNSLKTQTLKDAPAFGTLLGTKSCPESQSLSQSLVVI